MANDTYNLTQTGAQVQTIVNDANKVMGAGTQTTLTTDYVMLKDTSGNYHKIDKSSFTEAVRNTLASLLVNNDKGTTFGQIPVINSGDFGSATPANLASVLGDIKGIQQRGNPGQAINLNDCWSGIWYIRKTDYTVTNCPSETNGILIAYNGIQGYNTQPAGYTTQIFIDGVNTLYTRIYTNAWSAWKTISAT